MNRTLLLFWLLSSTLFIGKAQAQTGVLLGRTEQLRSRVLGEPRTYSVYVPKSAQDPLYARQRYPVLYVLDGETQFQSVVTTAERLAAARVIPEAIIVAVHNTNRVRDFTPTHITSGYYMSREEATSSGGGENFTRFLQQELAPHIDSLYSTTSYRMLIGHSLGGLLVLHTLLHHPTAFQAYVAIDPSLWWDEGLLVRQASALLKQPQLAGKTLFLPIATAFKETVDTVALTQRSTPKSRALLAVPDFVAQLRNHPSNGLRWSAPTYRQEGHNTMALPGTYDGLRYAFSAHRFLSVDNIKFFEPSVRTLRAQALKDSMLVGCQAISRQLGYSVAPPEGLVNRLGYAYLAQQDFAAAALFFEWNQANYPTSFNVHDAMGDYYSAQGNKRRAIQAFRKALTLVAYPETKQKLQALQSK
jgi:predicted alpha/beta superfamily hydrolase